MYYGIWKIVFFISLFFALLSFVPKIDLSSSLPLPVFLQNEINVYASESAIEEKQIAFQGMPIFAQIINMLPRILINVIAIMLLFSKKEVYRNLENKRVMRFLIVLLAFVNFTFIIPSVGVRFFKLVIPLLVFLLMKQPTITAKYKNLIYLLPVAYIADIISWIRHMADVTTLIDYVAPLPYLLVRYLT